jgi:hypothetical protein
MQMHLLSLVQFDNINHTLYVKPKCLGITYVLCVLMCIDPNGYVISLQGLMVTHVFTTIGAHHIEATARSPPGQNDDDDDAGLEPGSEAAEEEEDNKASVLGTATMEAYCLYVKREVRALSVEDRDRFLDAMVVMWNMDTKSGRAK